MADSRSSLVTHLRRRWLSLGAVGIAGALIATGCSNDEPPQIPPVTAAPSTAADKPSPEASASSAPADEPTGSDDDAEESGPNQPLLAAGATALGEVPDSTVVSIDSERRDTRWDVDLIDNDGRGHTVGVSKDGQQVISGPSADDDEDDDDRTENKQLIKAAEIDYKAAVSTVEAERPGRIVELALDEDDDRIIWEADVRDDGTRYDVIINAASGEVTSNTVDDD